MTRAAQKVSTVKGQSEDDRATIRQAPKRGMGSGGPFGSVGMPAEKSLDFVPSAKRLLGRLYPERLASTSLRRWPSAAWC